MYKFIDPHPAHLYTLSSTVLGPCMSLFNFPALPASFARRLLGQLLQQLCGIGLAVLLAAERGQVLQALPRPSPAQSSAGGKKGGLDGFGASKQRG